MPLREEPWGERLFQLTDPDGIVIQLVEWAPLPEIPPRSGTSAVTPAGAGRGDEEGRRRQSPGAPLPYLLRRRQSPRQ